MAYNMSFTKIISGASNIFGYINKAIPVYKGVSPMIKNAYKAVNSYKSISNAAKEATYKEIKAFERPKIIFRKNIVSERGKLNLDSLTFFNEKKN